MGRNRKIGMAMVVAMALLVAVPAAAGARPPRARGAPLPAARVQAVVLDRLAVVERAGDLVVRYAVDARTWRQAAALGAGLDLHVRLADGTSVVRRLSRRAGKVVVDLPARCHAREATVWIEGRGDRGVRYAGMVLGGRRLDVLSVALRDRGPAPRLDAHPPRDAFATGPRVIEACGRALIGNDATLACVRESGAYRQDPVPAIQACSDAMIGNEATLRCIGAAARVFADAPAVVTACERASIGNEATLQCIAASGAYAYGR